VASVTLHPDPQAFPIGTVVKVFALPSIPPPAGWVPSGAALTEPTVEQGEGGKQSVLTVTGLTVGKRYVGEAEVSGVRRTLTFSGGDEAAEGSGVTSVNGKSGAVTLAAGDRIAGVHGDADGADSGRDDEHDADRDDRVRESARDSRSGSRRSGRGDSGRGERRDVEDRSRNENRDG